MRDTVNRDEFVGVKTLVENSDNSKKYSIGSIRIEGIETTGDYKKYVELERQGLATEEDARRYLHKPYRIKPIMPSELPNVRIDYKGLLDYAQKKGVSVIELTDEEKNRFVSLKEEVENHEPA